MQNVSLIPTAEAAERIGVTVPAFHRLVAKGEISHAMKAPGLRGGMFFRRADVERLARARAKAAAKKAS